MHDLFIRFIKDMAEGKNGIVFIQRVYAGICDRLEEVKSPDVREKLEAALARVVQSWGGGMTV